MHDIGSERKRDTKEAENKFFEPPMQGFGPKGNVAELYGLPSGDEDHVGLYEIAESNFVDCLEIDQFGQVTQPLPEAFTPQLGLHFRTFDGRIEAKYGVRNYVREIARLYDETDDNLARLLPSIAKQKNPILASLNILKVYNEAHVLDVQVRKKRNGLRDKIYLRSLEPRSCLTHVVHSDSLDRQETEPEYSEPIVILSQREILVGKNLFETMCTVQPIGFTYHAMIRLWERGFGNGETFHTHMAEAVLRLRGVGALVELCTAALRIEEWPSQIAVPVLDGFVIASRRRVCTWSRKWRWGLKREREWFGILQPNDPERFRDESYTIAKGHDFTIRPIWTAVTFMGANDISDLDRVLAAQSLETLLENVDLDSMARFREVIDRVPDGSPSANIEISLPDPSEVMDLQRRMLPRDEPPDERWHILTF